MMKKRVLFAVSWRSPTSAPTFVPTNTTSFSWQRRRQRIPPPPAPPGPHRNLPFSVLRAIRQQQQRFRHCLRLRPRQCLCQRLPPASTATYMPLSTRTSPPTLRQRLNQRQRLRQRLRRLRHHFRLRHFLLRLRQRQFHSRPCEFTHLYNALSLPFHSCPYVKGGYCN